MTYYIYHISAKRKIGVTSNLKNRMIRHEVWHTKTFEILETHNCPQKAGDREIELQEQYGYPKDSSHYVHTISISKLGNEASKGKKRRFTKKWSDQLASVRNPQKAADSRKRIKCIHCGKEGLTGNINRWHNDNCKYI